MQHIPVLWEQVVSIVPNNAKIIVDGTLGHGGHSLRIAEYLEKHIKNNKHSFKILGLDVDQRMLNKAKIKLEQYKNKIILEYGSYVDTKNFLKKHNLKNVDFILLDLGVNIEHFKHHARGFSVAGNNDIDMRFDTSKEMSAYDVLQNYSFEQLKKLFMNYADFQEKKSIEIADMIIRKRNKKPIKSTLDFKNILYDAGLGKKASVVIFQALRIEVNQEIQNLKRFLDTFPEILNSSGICCIISYHSIEDRLVKNGFRKLSTLGSFELLNKKVIKPDYKEVKKNKASRSAKMRIIKKK